MKNCKRIISIIIIITLLISSFVLSQTFSVASADNAKIVRSASSEYGLADTVQNGVILHAWNVSLNNIKAALPDIAKAGFTTVQTSPIQQPKDYNSSWTDVSGQWWKLYQPLSLGSIATQSWVGTKNELASLCTEADKYGIKIICDIVANHLANDGPNTSVNPNIKNYESQIYNNQSTYFHTYNECNDNNIKNVVQGNIGMPDLNTGNTYVQERVINLLKECIDCGVDGFRFDAAKHIETPGDSSYSSNFWSNVLNTTTSYANSTKGITPYYYGEILNTCGNGRSFSLYSPYMSVTDNVTGNNIMWNVYGNNASGAATSYYNSGLDPSKVVLWAESHDTYADDSTSDVDQITINKAYSLNASRNKATSLYFIRTDGAKMGSIGSIAYKSTTISAVNHFHNYFVGSNEYLSSYNDLAICERYNDKQTGVVIVNCGGLSKTLNNVPMQKMKDGTYIDAVTGNTFTVTSGKISGNIGNSGVAVIYDSNGSYIAPTINENAGYFLVGNIGGKDLWPNGGDIPSDRKLQINTDCTYTEEYTLKGYTLHTGDEIKIVYYDGTSYTWFPASDNYKIVQSKAGLVNIYFRPNGDGDSSWLADGYMYLSVKEPETSLTEGTQTFEPTQTTTENQEPSTYKRVYVGQITYLKNNGYNPIIHYWNTNGFEGDKDIVYLNTQDDFKVGSTYWEGNAKTFNIGYVDIPNDATHIKAYVNDSTFNNKGWANEEIKISDTSNKIVCIFEWSQNLHNVLANYVEATQEPIETTTVTTNPTETTSKPTEYDETFVTTNINDLKDGYYLLGTFNGVSYWQNNIDINNKMYINSTNNNEEYILYKYLYPGDEMKVAKVENGVITQFYKNNDYSNYTVSANFRNKAGNYKILFRPKGKSNWLYTYINATKLNGNQTPTYPSQPTEATEPTKQLKTYIYGDTNTDGSITIYDVTLLQSALAQLTELTNVQRKCACLNSDISFSIADATLIQTYLAKLPNENKKIGTTFLQ